MKDFDMEKVIDKMRELRDTRDLEILKNEMDGIDLENDNQKELPKEKVNNIKYLGTIPWEDGTEKQIYLVIEQKEEKDGTLVEVERYYTEDGELLGGNNKGDNYDQILLNEKFLDHPELLEKLEALDKEGILDLNELEQDRLEEIARALGIEAKDVDKLAEMKKEDIEAAVKEVDGEEERETLSKEEVEKISTKTEIDTSQKVTDQDTLGSLLNTEGKGYRKIAIIYSEKLQENDSTTEFSFVGIKEDGSAEKIDSLEQEYGKNPNKEINTLNADGSKIEQKQVDSIYRIKGEDEKQLAVDIGSMGTIEPSLVRTPTQDNQEAISIPIETQAIRPTTRETRELMNEQRNPRIKEEIARAKEHEELGCEDVNIKDIDDDQNNNTHEHFEVDETYLQKCAKEMMKDEAIGEAFTEREVTDKLRRDIEKNSDKLSIEEIKERTRQELEEDAEHFKTREL